MKKIIITITLLSIVLGKNIFSDSTYVQIKGMIYPKDFNRFRNTDIKDSIELLLMGNKIKIGNVEMLFETEQVAFKPYMGIENKIQIKIDTLLIEIPEFAGVVSYYYIINDPSVPWKSYDSVPNINKAVFDDGNSHPKSIRILEEISIPKLENFQPFAFFTEQKNTIGLLFGGAGNRYGRGELYLIDTQTNEYLIKTIENGQYPNWSKSELQKIERIHKRSR